MQLFNKPQAAQLLPAEQQAGHPPTMLKVCPALIAIWSKQTQQQVATRADSKLRNVLMTLIASCKQSYAVHVVL
jgi:hypothetical protein